MQMILVILALTGAALASNVKRNVGSCPGTCVDIKANPSCDSYIHLGLCENGLGCCFGGGGGGGPAPGPAPAPAPAEAPAPAAPAPAPAPAPAGTAAPSGYGGGETGGKGGEGTGSCSGTCVDIKQNPSCAGYIHLGRCPNGLGCCI